MSVVYKNDLPVIPQPVALGLIVLLSLSCLNSYNGDFVFDDSEAIINNADVQNTPLFDVFKNDFWGTKLSHKDSHKSYRPLTILTFRLHYWLRGALVSKDFHIINIILHTIVCLLTLPVYNIFLGLKGHNVAVYACLLFSVHPVHTEAVSGVVGRAELLCAMFMWLSVLLYSQYIHTVKPLAKLIKLSGCIVCILIAMLCKETGITAIGICMLYDFIVVNNIYPHNIIKFLFFKYPYTSVKDVVILKLDFLLRQFILCITAILLLFLRLAVMGFSTPPFQPVDNPASFMENILHRILNYSYIYCLNIWLLICPEWLCFDWSMGCVPLITGWDKRLFFIITFWLIFGVLLLFILLHRKDRCLRYEIVSLGILIIPFLPASNIFFKVGFVLAERTLYVPSAGYCLLIAIGLQKLTKQARARKTCLILYVLLILIFFARSWIRSSEWKTEDVLFRSALSVCPLNAKVRYNIAKNAADNGNPALAKSEYREALRLNPSYAQAMNNLGNLLKDEGRYREAEKLFKEATKLKNDFAAAWMNLGIVLSASKKYNESENCYFNALVHRTKYPDCYYNLGVMYLEQKMYQKALIAWKNATRQDPTHRRAWTNIILLLDDIGMPEDALKAANEALKYIPNTASIHFNMANVFGKSRRYQEAETHFKTAITLNPADPMYYTNLGVLYHRWNKLEEAEIMYRKALKINPLLHSAADNLRKLNRLKSSIK